MCLTGVDYFSTLGYQPGIAFLAAQALSPIATLVLVLLTLFGALPIYNRVAEESPHGEGSISMLEHLLSRWKGKLFVLVLLGFVATDFVITITLSAADATAHIIENPFTPPLLKHQIGVTIALIAVLGAIFLKGFKEAIGIAVALVAAYLFLNSIVIGYGIYELATHPHHFPEWKQALFAHPRVNGAPWMIVLVSMILFPRLALGLSGFETGVAVMPLVKGDKELTEKDWDNIHSTRTGHGDEAKVQQLLRGRIENTKKLLRTAALIMCVLLISSSLATAILIPPEAFAEGGEANGRAISYLAHHFFGDYFGTVYDLSTICILWFAGASAMAGLLSIVPRYLPRYGMAPEWARAARPLVLVIILIAFAVTIIFRADVDAGVRRVRRRAGFARECDEDVAFRAHRTSLPAIQLPAIIAGTNIHASRTPATTPTRTGPGQKPASPQPTPKIAAPATRRTSITSVFGTRNSPPSAGMGRLKMKR